MNMTQEELAELINVTPQAISKWENSIGMPDISQLIPLANVFNVSVDTLLGINNNLVNDIMPNLTLSQRNKVLYVVMQISIYLGLFTTLISNVFLLSKFIEKYTKNLTMSIILSLMIGWLISLFGFYNIVGFVYIFIAIIGFGMVIGSRKGVVVFK